MNQEQIVLAVIRDTIAQAPEEQRTEIETAARRIRSIVQEAETGPMALALVGAEYAAANP